MMLWAAIDMHFDVVFLINFCSCINWLKLIGIMCCSFGKIVMVNKEDNKVSKYQSGKKVIIRGEMYIYNEFMSSSDFGLYFDLWILYRKLVCSRLGWLTHTQIIIILEYIEWVNCWKLQRDCEGIAQVFSTPQYVQMKRDFFKSRLFLTALRMEKLENH